MRDYPARIWLYTGEIIETTIRSESLCAAMHKVKLDYEWRGIVKFEVLPAPLSKLTNSLDF